MPVLVQRSLGESETVALPDYIRVFRSERGSQDGNGTLVNPDGVRGLPLFQIIIGEIAQSSRVIGMCLANPVRQDGQRTIVQRFDLDIHGAQSQRLRQSVESRRDGRMIGAECLPKNRGGAARC